MAFSYVIWLFVFLFVSYGLGRLYAPLRRSRLFKIIFLPGFLAMGSMKLLACSISGAEIRSVRIFARDREIVSYDPEDVSLLGKVILATFPLIGAFLIFAFVAWGFAYPLGFMQELSAAQPPPAMTGSIHHLGGTVLHSLEEMMQATGGAFYAAGEGNYMPFLYLYIIISILLAMPPPKGELKYAVLGVLIVAVVIWAVTWAGIQVSGRAAGACQDLWLIFSFALAMLVYVTAVTLTAILISGLIQSLTARRSRRAN